MRLEDRVKLPARYRVIGFIAGGGMAGVWEAEDTRLGRVVAVKVLAEHLAEDPINRRRFEREARAAARVSSHPHVVTIYDVGEHQGRSFMVMERLSGRTVADAIRRGPVRRDRALTWLRDAAAALDTAHEQGIVHRDVKPGNLLRDGDERVRVADFGIARIVSDETITSTGQLIGTAAYLSPEQVLGQETTAASDRYQLAVVAYELLTGRRPFTATHPTAQARQHVEDLPPLASTVDPTVPETVDPVLARGLDKDPARRWPTATAFAGALEAAINEGTVITRRVAPMAPPVRRRPRPALPALAALAAAAVAIAVVIGLTSGGGDSHTLSRASALAGRAHKAKAAPRHRAATKPKTTPKKTAPPPSTPSATDVASLNSQQVQAYGEINGGNPQAGLTADRAILAALSSQGYSVARCRQPSDEGCLVFAHALFDVGHALRLLDQPAAAIATLRQRLAIDDQRPIVQAELRAVSALLKPGKGPKHGKHGNGGASGPAAQGD